jgi:predicted XRE-type DNA-binding protein
VLSPDFATVHALRQDLALQIDRFIKRSGVSQMAAAKSLGIPQPTLSKIANARVADLSLELLIRIAVRARLPLVLHTGKDPDEAGVFEAGNASLERTAPSRLSRQARRELEASARLMTPEVRLEAQQQHSQLLAELHLAGKSSRNDVTDARKKRRS